MPLDSKKLSLLTLALLSLSFTAEAQTQRQHVITATACLVKSTEIPLKTLAVANGFVLIETNDAGLDALIDAKATQRSATCGGFMDVTEAWKAFHPKTLTEPHRAKQFLIKETAPATLSPRLSKANYEIKYEKHVNQTLAQINPQNLWDNLTVLTNFNDRYANSDSGVQAANKIKAILSNYNQRDDVTIYTIATGTRYKQPSVIAKIGHGTGPGIVIGAHMDTLAANFSKKPGADDDGSGSVTVLEVARILLSSNTSFKKPIYLMWYAAEEQGLVGSSYVVAEFKQKNIPIDAVIHFDMTGYAYKNDPALWLIDDYTNKDLTQYLEKLITTYVKQAVKYTRCGYACSDHASWTKGGFVAAMPAEAAYEQSNPHLHTAQDTLDKLSLNHMTDYVKLGTAFAIEMAEPITA